MRCLAVCQSDVVIRILDDALRPRFGIEFLVESKPLARRLHDAAVVIARDGWPEDLRTLPGVGAYTAGAVANCTRDADVPAIDVNVRRVLERRAGRLLTPREADAAYLRTGRGLEGRDRFLAIMDLGAMVCRAREPRCEECPLRRGCATRGPLAGEVRTRQAPFEGSFRQRRGRVMARLRAADAVPVGELVAHSRRSPSVAFARQSAMYLAHVSFGLSFSEVARGFRRDRTTAAHACQLVEDRRDDPTVGRRYRFCQARDYFSIACFCAIDGRPSLAWRYLARSIACSPGPLLRSPRRFAFVMVLGLQVLLPATLFKAVFAAVTRLAFQLTPGRPFAVPDAPP